MKRHAPTLAKHTNASEYLFITRIQPIYCLPVVERLIRERGYDHRDTPNSQALPLPSTQQAPKEAGPSPPQAASFQ